MGAQPHHADGSHAVAVDLDDVADLGHVDKLVDEALTVHLGQDASLVVVPGKKNDGFECRSWSMKLKDKDAAVVERFVQANS
jgi:hypothetical protein